MNVPSGYKTVGGFLWPATDTKAAPVLFSLASDINHVLPHCRGFDVAVQAGGNCGIWPHDLARKFRVVYTFEPDPVNFRCLCANVPNENVYKFNAALGAEHRQVGLALRPDNIGAHCVDGPGDIPTLRIDDLGLHSCDLIYLDVEGYEIHALVGAQETIARTRPTVVVEDKGLTEKYGIAEGEAVAFLANRFGYKVKTKLHRDIVLVP